MRNLRTWIFWKSINCINCAQWIRIGERYIFVEDVGKTLVVSNLMKMSWKKKEKHWEIMTRTQLSLNCVDTILRIAYRSFKSRKQFYFLSIQWMCAESSFVAFKNDFYKQKWRRSSHLWLAMTARWHIILCDSFVIPHYFVRSHQTNHSHIFHFVYILHLHIIFAPCPTLSRSLPLCNHFKLLFSDFPFQYF